MWYQATSPLRGRIQRTFLFCAGLLVVAPAVWAQAIIDDRLQQELRGMPPGVTTEVIIVFDQMEPITEAQRVSLLGIGITTGIIFEELPIAGVLATGAQILALANRQDVRSLWANEELEYFHETSRALIGVDRLREDPNLRVDGVPVSGSGVSVLVNDSGIDATHPDLQFGTHVVENVQALTNLNAVSGLLPITYIEGQPNTDVASGHGTHVAGSIGATGAGSAGLYEGVAPGADLVGYGSGAVILILDALGGFDYAITKQFAFENPIRVISNSWGSSADFNHEHPIVQASYHAHKRGINVVFSAGNAGSGEDTHNPYAQAPWVISVGAGDKGGRLAGFSSRGLRGYTRTFTMPDGVEWTGSNEVTVTGPGVNIISTRASTDHTTTDLDLEFIPPEYLPFYTVKSGTSMSAPHVAGVIALMLEADPSLKPDDVRQVLRKTATNIPGHDAWEAGVGFVNAYAAVAFALGDARYTGATVNALRTFNANVDFGEAFESEFSISFDPVGSTEHIEFEVEADVAVVSARARITDNLVALVLFDPDGERYGSAISIPLIGERVAVSAPGKPGTWVLTVRGVGAVAGVPTDPLGITNGTSLPGVVDGTLKLDYVAGYSGLDDLAGHPAKGLIQLAVGNRLVDALANGFLPDGQVLRQHVAEYLVMGAGVRQIFPSDGSNSFGDVAGFTGALAEAVTATGAALKDPFHVHHGVMRAEGGQFAPSGVLNRVDVAYSLIQSLGLGGIAHNYAEMMDVDVDGERIPLADAHQIPEQWRGHVQLALELRLMNARIVEVDGQIEAYFDSDHVVLRGEFAVYMTRLHNVYDGLALPPGDDTPPVGTQDEPGAAMTVSLDGHYPNPVHSSAIISFSLHEMGHVRLELYDVMGRRVAVLVDHSLPAGGHELEWSANGIASGVYIYRIEANGQSAARRMTVVR